MKVRIYTHTRTKKNVGVCVYVVEAPELPTSKNNPVTKVGVITEASRNEAEVTCLLNALERLRASSDVEIHTESGYIRAELNMLKSHERAGFKNSRGIRIKYAYIWEKIAWILDTQENVEVILDTDNEWVSWMKSEADRRLEAEG